MSFLFLHFLKLFMLHPHFPHSHNFHKVEILQLASLIISISVFTQPFYDTIIVLKNFSKVMVKFLDYQLHLSKVINAV